MLCVVKCGFSGDFFFKLWRFCQFIMSFSFLFVYFKYLFYIESRMHICTPFKLINLSKICISLLYYIISLILCPFWLPFWSIFVHKLFVLYIRKWVLIFCLPLRIEETFIVMLLCSNCDDSSKKAVNTLFNR